MLNVAGLLHQIEVEGHLIYTEKEIFPTASFYLHWERHIFYYLVFQQLHTIIRMNG
jgi:hypothetical protein